MADGQSESTPGTLGVASGVIAACFGLAAFTVAILSGLASGNAAASVLLRAVIAMTLCYPVGLVVGLICQRVLAEHLRSQREADPAPEEAGIERSTSHEEAESDEEVLVV